jgi:hypothetical protein
MGWTHDQQKQHGNYDRPRSGTDRILDAARAAARRRDDRDRAMTALGATAAVLILVAAIAALMGTRWA